MATQEKATWTEPVSGASGNGSTARVPIPPPREAPPREVPPAPAPMPEPAVGRSDRDRKRARARLIRRGLFGLLAVAAAALVAVAVWPRSLPVDMVTLSRGPMLVTVDETGRMRVRERYLVASPVTGYIPRLAFDPGDRVEEGQVLVRVSAVPSPLLDDRSRVDAELRLATALSAERQARTVVERTRIAVNHARRRLAVGRQLLAAGSVSEQQISDGEFELKIHNEELAAAELGARMAKEEVARVRAMLSPQRQASADERFEIRAPSAGTILKVLQEGPGPIAAGSPLVEVGDLASLEAVIDVLSTDAVQIRPGARATLERWGVDVPLPARVQSVEPAAFTRISALGLEEQRVNVILRLEEAGEAARALGDGYRVEARITVWESPDVLAVPVSAIFRHGEGWAVYRVDEGRAQIQEVGLGRRNAEAVEILRGLDAGARIVSYPSDRLRAGAKVVPRG